MKRYSIIYIDPPFEFKQRGDGVKGHGHGQGGFQAPQANLASLNLSAISLEDSVLLMWVTFPHLEEALWLGQSWGFIYKTVAFVWIKKKGGNDHLYKGMGYYTRSNAELVLLFTRGRTLKRQSSDVGQVVITKVDEYSTKPPEVKKRIVRLFGDLPRVELFCRHRRDGVSEDDGWDVFEHAGELMGSRE